MEQDDLLKSFWVRDTHIEYSLEGLGGEGTLSLSFIKEQEDKLNIHIKCIAKIKPLFSFHFEARSVWTQVGDSLRFCSYEEKDFTKKISKKWVPTEEGLNYFENKKGVCTEREIQYINPPKDGDIIYDPISAPTIALRKRDLERIYIFGKQRIILIHVQEPKKGILKVTQAEGVNARWTKILQHTEIELSEERIPKKIEIPSPLYIGKIRMNMINKKEIDPEKAVQVLKSFERGIV